MDGWMGGRMDRLTDMQTDRRTDRQIMPLMAYWTLSNFGISYVWSFSNKSVTRTLIRYKNVDGLLNLFLSIQWNICIIYYLQGFFYFSQIYNLLYKWSISKYVVRKHLCGAIIQWWFSYIYRTLCCACLYSSSSLWSFKSEGHCV
jgi:hypothetical protein